MQPLGVKKSDATKFFLGKKWDGIGRRGIIDDTLGYITGDTRWLLQKWKMHIQHFAFFSGQILTQWIWGKKNVSSDKSCLNGCEWQQKNL